MPHLSNRNIRTIVYILAGAALLCFYVFLNDASRLGGDAIAGKVENGHYYVGSPRGYTEVTFAEYRTNKILAITVMITFPVATIALVIVERDRTKAFERYFKLWTHNLWQGKAARQRLSKKKIGRRN